MAKIIYAVAGEGFGHSSRAHLIGQRLIDSGHELMFAGSNKSLAYLRQYFPEQVRQVHGFSFQYDSDRIDYFKTIINNIQRAGEGIKINDELFSKHYATFSPDLLITDFEPFSAWWALWNQVPFISIGHQHMLTLCKLRHNLKNWFSKLTADVITESYFVGAAAYVIVNFFRARLKIDAAVLAPPVVRNEVKNFTAEQGDYVLLYSTAGQDRDKLIKRLNGFKKRARFIVYGFNEDSEKGNCILRKRSTEDFLRDLAGCRGVVASAGFSLISECMYFRKKMLLLPLKGQYEQMMNSYYVEKLGLGLEGRKINRRSIRKFLQEVEKPISEDRRILWPDNEKFFGILHEQFKRLPKPIEI